MLKKKNPRVRGKRQRLFANSGNERGPAKETTEDFLQAGARGKGPSGRPKMRHGEAARFFRSCLGKTGGMKTLARGKTTKKELIGKTPTGPE